MRTAVSAPLSLEEPLVQHALASPGSLEQGAENLRKAHARCSALGQSAAGSGQLPAGSIESWLRQVTKQVGIMGGMSSLLLPLSKRASSGTLISWITEDFYVYRALVCTSPRNYEYIDIPILWPPDAKSLLIGKDSDAGRDWGQEEKGEWDGWMASPTRWTWVWVNSRSWWWTGRPGVLQFMGSQRVGHDWVAELNWDKNITIQFASCDSSR